MIIPTYLQTHTYETKQCRAPRPQESFWSRGELKACDKSLCYVYLTSFKLLDTATAENAFVIEFHLHVRLQVYFDV